MSSSDTSYKLNDIVLENVILFNSKGNFVDIQGLLMEFNVYHTLFTSGVEADFLLMDSNAIIDFLPVVGDETIYIEFKTPTFDIMRNYVLKVFSITDRQKQDRMEGYTLNAVSIENINDLRKSVNKSFVGLYPHEIVKAIYNNYLKPSQIEHKLIKKEYNITTQETKDKLPIIISGRTPYEAIKYIANESIPAGNTQISSGSSFLFYERSDGWQFNTLDFLLAKAPVEDFYLAPAKTEKPAQVTNPIHEYQNISNIKVKAELDTLDNINGGLYSHKIETIDPIYKSFRKDTFNYKNDYSALGHIEDREYLSKDVVKIKQDFNSEYLIPKKSFLNEDNDTTSTYYHISTLHNPERKDTDPQLLYQRRVHDVVKYDIAARMKIDNIILEIIIPGNSDIHIGNIVNLHIPISSENEEYLNSLIRLYDKKFLVTSVRHVYQKKDNIYFTVLECMKDTYAVKTEQIDETPDAGFEE